MTMSSWSPSRRSSETLFAQLDRPFVGPPISDRDAAGITLAIVGWGGAWVVYGVWLLVEHLW